MWKSDGYETMYMVECVESQSNGCHNTMMGTATTVSLFFRGKFKLKFSDPRSRTLHSRSQIHTIPSPGGRRFLGLQSRAYRCVSDGDGGSQKRGEALPPLPHVPKSRYRRSIRDPFGVRSHRFRPWSQFLSLARFRNILMFIRERSWEVFFLLRLHVYLLLMWENSSRLTYRRITWLMEKLTPPSPLTAQTKSNVHTKKQQMIYFSFLVSPCTSLIGILGQGNWLATL